MLRSTFVALGFLFTMIVGGLVVWRVLRRMREQIEIPRISTEDSVQSQWERLIRHPDVSGTWVGYVERVVFFVAIFMDRWEAIGVWLAFKVASKWEAWNHMGYVPDSVAGVDPLAFAAARRLWAAQGYGTFLVGTFLNVAIAALGVVIARHGQSAVLELFCT